jgi:Fe-S-cluster-containing dehydrogenase component/formylmethanofuran dehydrogenase subunit B
MSTRYDNILLNGKEETPPGLPLDRRDFLKLAGFTLAGGVLSGCQPAKVEKAIPFLIKPEEVTPGVATWYASTCAGCNAGCGLLVKNRDGRPIKLEGNPEHPISKGGLCAVGQASILSLYDSQRLQTPLLRGTKASWKDVDEDVEGKLQSIRNSRGKVRLLTGTITSPTTNAAITTFLSAFSDARHISYDPLSSSAILDAHRLTHGARVLPRYRFDRADVIVSFDADFLGTWISPVEFTAAYRSGRTLERTPPKFSRHFQVESRLSVTGSNADERFRVHPNEVEGWVGTLSTKLAALAGTSAPRIAASMTEEANTKIDPLARSLWNARGRSLVVCGVNDLRTQLLVNFINHLLGNYGTTLDLERPSFQHQGDDAALLSLIDEIKSGSVDALLIHGVNPAYDLPTQVDWKNLLPLIPLVVRLSSENDETATLSHVVCPTPDPLESWSDAEPVSGVVSIQQPVIEPFGQTRTLAECLSAWMGKPSSMLDLIREEWKRSVYRRRTASHDFDTFWTKTVHDGFAEVSTSSVRVTSFNLASLNDLQPVSSHQADTDTLTLVLFPTVPLRDGRHAHNPWLQELPDPVTKVVWDNYASLSPSTASRVGVREGDVVRIEHEGESLELPAHLQPGQHDSVVAVALGYGRQGTDRFTNIGPRWLEARPTVPPGEFVGKNAALFLRFEQGALHSVGLPVALSKTGRTHRLASTQDHHSIRVPDHLAPEGSKPRPIIQETTYAAYVDDAAAGSFQKHELPSMWPEEHQYEGHHWGMAIDLTACTGCSACVVSCMAENNIPVVGKDEVSRNREMAWIRVDRYYNESEGEFTVSHQPMMCQHCDNAPCETVCPVLATVHSEEGLNQQVYNRCVGTRYCANNCPYKVRRFNWFDYEHGDEMHKLVLNPDITVRERGVMEKCSFCVQRIQEAKIAARKRGEPVQDGEIQTACQQSCPAQAIEFGDMNDPNSAIAKRLKDPRHYRVLEEIGVRPSIAYLTRVRNKGEASHE